MKQHLGGNRGPLLVSSLLERAGILREMGQLPAAQDSLAEAQSIATQKLDRTDHRLVLLQLEHGRLLLSAGRPREADEELQSVVKTLRARQEPIHLADALASLSDAFAANAEIEPARSAANEALGIRQHLLPPDHPSIAASKTQIARLQAPELPRSTAERTAHTTIETGITARK